MQFVLISLAALLVLQSVRIECHFQINQNTCKDLDPICRELAQDCQSSTGTGYPIYINHGKKRSAGFGWPDIFGHGQKSSGKDSDSHDSSDKGKGRPPGKADKECREIESEYKVALKALCPQTCRACSSGWTVGAGI